MVIDDKVAFVLVKLSHLAVQRDREAYLRGLIDLCAQATDAERLTAVASAANTFEPDEVRSAAAE